MDCPNSMLTCLDESIHFYVLIDGNKVCTTFEQNFCQLYSPYRGCIDNVQHCWETGISSFELIHGYPSSIFLLDKNCVEWILTFHIWRWMGDLLI
uniref:Uncharacterized protein n=1 Tax=Arundo donax TaxID=35708 RepID=A0A0A9B2W4_ARUDO